MPTPSRASAWRCCECSEGRAFVLFTSYAMLRAVEPVLATTLDYPMLVQGRAPRSALLAEFRQTPHAVLLATSSFWQGVDVVGDALSCVIIDKLPFASPGDPITSARMEAMTDAGRRSVRGLSGAAGDPDPPAGSGASHPASAGPRPAGRARPAAADDGVRPAVPGVAAAGADHARPRRRSPILRSRNRQLGSRLGRFFGFIPRHDDALEVSPMVRSTAGRLAAAAVAAIVMLAYAAGAGAQAPAW